MNGPFVRRLAGAAAIGVLAFFAIGMGMWAPGEDARAYYDADLDNLYPGSIFSATYGYSPAFAWWLQPFQALPFPAWLTAISAASITALAWLVSPWLAVAALVVQLPPIWRELQFGNLNLVTAAVVALAMRWPALWAFPLLTKVTPGIGLVWFLVRREWRSLGIALAVTVALAIPVTIVRPELWWEWAQALQRNAGLDAQVGVPIILRAAVAAAVIGWGALTDRPWTVPVGAALVAHVNGDGWLVVLGAIPLFRWASRFSRRGSPSTTHS